MSHIFISYAHKDKHYLDQLLITLQAAGFSAGELWYDYHLEAGSQWIPQIDDALKEAFALVVIATPKAMKSTYVTYEWSWALGNSIPVFPLLFEGSYDKVHTRLRAEQGADCRTTIPDHIVETLKSKRGMPADTKYLNLLLSNTTLRFQVVTIMALWFYDHRQDASDFALWEEIKQKLLIECQQLFVEKLPFEMVDKSHAFNLKLLRICRQLVDELRHFWDIFHEPSYIETGSYLERSVEQAMPEAKQYWESTLQKTLERIKCRENHIQRLSVLEKSLFELSQSKSRDELFLKFGYFNWHTIIDDLVFRDDEEFKSRLNEAIRIVETRNNSPESSDAMPE